MDDVEENGLTQVTDLIESAVTGIPTPIKKNFFKVVATLCTAAIDVPVAYLESKADEIRAVAKARRSAIETSGEKLASQINIPQVYSDKATEKFLGRILKQQVNIDNIVKKTGEIILEEPPLNEENNQSDEDEISDEWLNEFEDLAKLKSSEDMQDAFSRILLGEVKKPGSFSIRTVRIMSQLDNKAAKVFQRLVACTFRLKLLNYTLDYRVFSMGVNPSANGLYKFGLSFNDLNILQEYGLIISDYNSYMDYKPAVVVGNKVMVPIVFNGDNYALFYQKEGEPPKTFRINGVGYSNAGKELFSVVKVESDKAYFDEAKTFLSTQGYELARIEKN